MTLRSFFVVTFLGGSKREVALHLPAIEGGAYGSEVCTADVAHEDGIFQGGSISIDGVNQIKRKNGELKVMIGYGTWATLEKWNGKPLSQNTLD